MSKKITTFKRKAHDALDQFLDEHRTSPGDGWADFPESDEALFHTLMLAILKAKFEGDMDGAYPLEYTLVNRKRYNRLQYFPVEYFHKNPTIYGYRQYLLNARTNLSIATREVDMANVYFEDLLKNMREEQEKYDKFK